MCYVAEEETSFRKKRDLFETFATVDILARDARVIARYFNLSNTSLVYARDKEYILSPF